MLNIKNVMIIYIYNIVVNYIFKNGGKCHFFTLLNVVFTCFIIKVFCSFCHYKVAG